jgi:hypothetical protein
MRMPQKSITGLVRSKILATPVAMHRSNCQRSVNLCGMV